MHWTLFKLLLQGHRFTMAEAAEELGCSLSVARVHLNNMTANRIVRIISVSREGRSGPPSSVFILDQTGTGKRKNTHYKPLTNAEKCRASKARRAAREATPRLGVWGL